jgi:AraC-like DNA-binding protein
MMLEHRPAFPLAAHIVLFWHDEGYRAVRHHERVLPPGGFCLTIDIESGLSGVSGMRSKHIEIDTGPIQTVMGVLFHPGGARAFFDASAEEFQNRTVPLDLVWGEDGKGLCERLRGTICPSARFHVLEDVLLRRLKPKVVLHPAMRYGLEEFRRAPHIRSVLSVVKDAGLSRRRFSQLFREHVGLTPKLYCRLNRFHWVVRRVASGKPVNWVDVAAAGGYSDQAHLAHEFRDFSGLSPSAFLAAERPSCAHVRVP